METNINIPFGTSTIPRLVAPVGFYSILTDYRRYIEDVVRAPLLITDGQYRLPTDKVDKLEKERKGILANYSGWKNKLNERQTSYLDNDAQLLSINNEMLKDLNSDVAEITERLLKRRVKNVKEFKVGDEPVAIEKKVKLSTRGEQYKTTLESVSDKIKDFPTSPSSIASLKNDMTLLNGYRVELDRYDKLGGPDKVALEVEKGRVTAALEKAFDKVESALATARQGQLPEPRETPPPPGPELPVSRESQPPPEPKPEQPPPEPRPKRLPLADARALQSLITYAGSFAGKGSNYSKGVKKALSRFDGGDEILSEAKVITESRDRKKLVGGFLQRLRKPKGSGERDLLIKDFLNDNMRA